MIQYSQRLVFKILIITHCFRDQEKHHEKWCSWKFDTRYTHKSFTSWKLSRYGGFSAPYFPVFRLNREKYGPEKSRYLDNFHVEIAIGKRLMWERILKNRVLKKHAKNNDALSPNRSTCVNESFKLVVASRALKMHPYSKLESLDFRLAAVVYWKDIGQTYMFDVNTLIGLSPVKISRKFY